MIEKTALRLQKHDILFRTYPLKEECEIKDIIFLDAHRRVFYFSGFLADRTIMEKMFKHHNGYFEVKGEEK